MASKAPKSIPPVDSRLSFAETDPVQEGLNKCEATKEVSVIYADIKDTKTVVGKEQEPESAQALSEVPTPGPKLSFVKTAKKEKDPAQDGSVNNKLHFVAIEEAAVAQAEVVAASSEAVVETKTGPAATPPKIKTWTPHPDAAKWDLEDGYVGSETGQAQSDGSKPTPNQIQNGGWKNASKTKPQGDREKVAKVMVPKASSVSSSKPDAKKTASMKPQVRTLPPSKTVAKPVSSNTNSSGSKSVEKGSSKASDLNSNLPTRTHVITKAKPTQLSRDKIRAPPDPKPGSRTAGLENYMEQFRPSGERSFSNFKIPSLAKGIESGGENSHRLPDQAQVSEVWQPHSSSSRWDDEDGIVDLTERSKPTDSNNLRYFLST